MIKSPLEVYKYCYSRGNTCNIPADWNITTNFSWREAFTNEDPADNVPFYDAFLRIYAAAERFQAVRTALGKPFIVHSWYRSIRHNKRADSTAELSLHCYGTALDFHVDGMTDADVRSAILEKCPSVRVEADTTGWVHIDTGHPYTTNGYQMGLFYA